MKKNDCLDILINRRLEYVERREALLANPHIDDARFHHELDVVITELTDLIELMSRK